MATTINPNSALATLEEVDLKALAKAAKFVGKRTLFGALLMSKEMGDGTLDGYTPEQLKEMIGQIGTADELLDPKGVEKRRIARKQALAKAKANRINEAKVKGQVEAADKGDYINKAIIHTPEGVIYSPDPSEEIDLEEWKRRNIHSTPILEPNKDDYTTGGNLPEINLPTHTGSPPVEIDLPTHTGDTTYKRPKTIEDYILTMSGPQPKINPEMTDEVFETLDNYFVKDKDGKIISTTVGPERDIIKKTISDVVDKYGVDKAIKGSVVQRFLEQALKNNKITQENYDIYSSYRDRSAVSKINPSNIERTKLASETNLLKGKKLLEVAHDFEKINKKNNPNSQTGFTHKQLLLEANKKYPDLFTDTGETFESTSRFSLIMKPWVQTVPELKNYLSGKNSFGSERVTEDYTVEKGKPRMDIKFRSFISQNKDRFPGAQGDTIGTQKEKSRFLYYVLSGMRGGNAAISKGDYTEALKDFDKEFPGGFNSLSDKSGPSELKDQFIKFKAKDDVRYKLMNLNQGQGEVLPENIYNIRPFLQEVFGETVKLNMAHDFERSQVRKEDSLQSFATKGGDASFINIDVDVVNTQVQPEIEKEIRKLENIEEKELAKASPDADVLAGIDFKVKKLEDRLIKVGGQGISKFGQIGQSIPFYDKLNQIIDEYNIKAETEGRPSAMKKYPNLRNALKLLEQGDGIKPFAEGGKLTGKEYQHFFEEGVGDKVGSLRTLGTLWKGRLLTGASSGFGNEYAAENLPILKDMDPLSRGIWNTIAPYGEKAFDVVDTLFRLPGSFVADTFEGFGVDEDKANKLQAEINTMLAMPVAGGPTSAAGRMKSLKTVSDTAKKLKNIEKSSDNIIGPMPLGEVVNMPQPLGKAKEVGLGFKSKLNPNTKKLELYQEGELVGSFDSIADAQSTMKQINAGKWKGKADYKTTKSKINQGWEIRFPGQTNTMEFKTKKEAQQYIKDNYPDVPPNITVHKVDKGTVVTKDKKGDFSRYSLMFEDIQTNYSPKEIKTASQWIGELKNRGHTKELDKGGFGYTLFKKGNEKLSAEDLFKLRKEKGSQLNTETIRMGTADTINLLGEFDSIHIQYVDSLVPMGGVTARNPAFQHAFSTRWGSLPGKTQKYIKDKVDNFANYYKNFLERNDGRLTATQDNVLNGRIDKVLAEITIAAEKAGGGNAWAPKLADFNAPNFSLNVYQAANDVLSKTQMGAASRRFLTNLKNLRRDYGVTRSHANLTLPGKAQKTHRTDVYTYNPIKGQVNTSDVVSTHMGQRNELAHVRKTDRSSLDGQNGVLLDEIQFDVLKNVAKNDKAVFKAETMGGQADALAEQVKTLEAQRARVKNLELKKLIVKSDIEPVMDYNLPRNQRALIEEAKTIPDDSPMMAEIINKIEQEGDVGDWLMNNSKAYAKIENELARIEKEFSGTVTAKTGMPDIPFRQHEEMLGEIFKIEIGKAIENNKDFVAIPLPEVVFGYESATGGNMAVAFNNIYRKNSLRALKTLQENYKKRLESLGIDGEAFKITSGDDVNIWLSWDKNSSTSDGFMSKINAMKREHGIDNAEEFYKKLNSGQIDRNQMPLLPFEIGEMPGGKIAVKPGIVIDLRNMNGFDRKQLAKIGFKEYKEGGSTNINKYSALAGIDILGVAI